MNTPSPPPVDHPSDADAPGAPSVSPHAPFVLGIETSCDETAAAVTSGWRVLSSVVASQHDLHAEYRGVVPEIASRAHAQRILPVVREALALASIDPAEIRAVAVGNRPGLIGSLLVGVAAAKALAWANDLPVIGVDHVHAHVLSGLLDRADLVPHTPITPSTTHPGPAAASSSLFPAIGLVVSGGHTSLYHLPTIDSIHRLGATRDDAAGEAFDKAAAVLSLPFPGGPALDRLASTGNPDRYPMPVSRLGPDSLDFSFSGVKTAVLYALRGVPAPPPSSHPRPPHARSSTPRPTPPGPIVHSDQDRADLAASFQAAVVRALLLKVERALERHPDTRTLLLGGGVCANSALRAGVHRLARARALTLLLPEMRYCVDNAAMIAALGAHRLAARAWRSDPLTMTATPTTLC